MCNKNCNQGRNCDCQPEKKPGKVDSVGVAIVISAMGVAATLVALYIALSK